jgi:hypothetical protein
MLAIAKKWRAEMIKVDFFKWDEVTAKLWQGRGKTRLYFNVNGKTVHWVDVRLENGVAVGWGMDFLERDLVRQPTKQEIGVLIQRLGLQVQLPEPPVSISIDEEVKKIKAICEAAADCRVDDETWCATVERVEPFLEKFIALPHTERVRIGKLLKAVPIFGNVFAEDVNGPIFAEV